LFNALTDKPILYGASASEASTFLSANSPFHPAISFLQNLIERNHATNNDDDTYSFYSADLSGDCEGLDFGWTQTPTYSYSYDAVEEWYDPYNSSIQYNPAIQLKFDFNQKNNPHNVTKALKKILQEEVDSSDWKDLPEDSE
jgi:hypothetical protein